MTKKYVFLNCLVCVFLVHCASENAPLRLSNRVIHVMYTMPIVERDGTVSRNESYYNVFSANQINLFQYQYKFDSSQNGREILSEKRSAFFIFHIDSTYGYKYNLKNLTEEKLRLPVDSMLREISFESSKLDTILKLTPDSFYYSNDRNLLTEKYKFDSHENKLNNYTVYLTFNKQFNNIKETFSKKLDSAKKMKLIGMVFKFEEVYSDEYKIIFPKREISFLMKERSIKNPEAALDILDRYKKLASQ